ncbi:uncharacterized protein I206_100690 [Kwoniella pini CBS 10737]|uniref:Uncharacterized protein n=1 Tax=Kwoniella pini CBS 10737 TaxID=1296096 RepID=A0A1B9ICW9_9TREE|nr:uncharacterized protein I206_00635 [Kwoniella pini CBS 10737]OCF53333.1 hypothetical protein I206_00635 [Kwoniella pini CBS 10737]
MSSTSQTVNVTFDDFDPIFLWPDLTQWSTPNPQDHPEWINATESETGLPWHEATLHWTTTKGAEFSLNFTTTEIWLYGALNVSSPSYTITLDGQSTTQNPSSVSSGRALLYSATDLSQSSHQLTVRNEGEGLGLDYVVLGYDLGENPQNQTIDDALDQIQYDGTWTRQGGNFFNGTNIYTQGPGNSFNFSFAGSGLYIYGDSVQDHGDFSVYFNDSQTPYGTWNARTPCGGQVEFGKTCEKLGSLKAFIGNLPAGTHQVKVVNDGPEGSNATFFDFDYVEYTTPSTYPSFTLNATCANGICADSVSPSNSASGTQSTSPSSSSSSSASPSGSNSASGGKTSGSLPQIGVANTALFGVLSMWALRKLVLGRLS